MSLDTFSYLFEKYEKSLLSYGFEIKPFLIGWYNDKVDEEYHLRFPYDTVAFNIINTPTMFEKTVIDFIKRSELSFFDNKHDILDEAITDVLNQVKNDISNDFLFYYKTPLKTIIIRDYECNSVTRTPKVVVCTAGHVSGQARYYQRHDISPDLDPWDKNKKIYGCSLHETYGGWFAFRGAIIFPELQHGHMERMEPADPLHGDPNLVIHLLNEFNFNWRSWSFRNTLPDQHTYSDAFKLYLSTAPGEKRVALVKGWWESLRTWGDSLLVDSDASELRDWGM